MSDPSPQSGPPVPPKAALRKADFWTGLVLATVALAMIGEALTFPLRGTYAGVQNAWYVSPALFPLIVGGMLLLLSVGLVGKALQDYRRLHPDGRLASIGTGALAARSGDAVLIAGLLAAYIVGLVPRTDFVIATSLFLLVFMGVYTLSSRAGRAFLVLGLTVPAAVAFGVAVAGTWPAPRSLGQQIADAWLLGVLVVAMLGLVAFARGDERRRVVPVLATATGAALVLGVVFKFGLIVPLPREGLAVLLMETAANRLSGLLG